MEKLLNKIGNDFSILSGSSTEDSSLSNNLEIVKNMLNKYIQEKL